MNPTGRKTPDIEEFKDLLKKKGLKATIQRIAVHEAMLELGHASADMVTEVLSSGKTAKVTTASVYNILTQLADLGVYSRRFSANNKMYFDVNTCSHLHLYDMENNEYRDIIDDEVTAYLQEKLGRKRFKGYSLDFIDVQLVCHPTKKKRS